MLGDSADPNGRAIGRRCPFTHGQAGGFLDGPGG